MQLIFKVDGMSCSHCRARVLNALQQVPGVQSADVDLEKGEASVTYDGKAETMTAAVDAVEACGFDVTAPSAFDLDGSYTGVPVDENSKPVQDADDL